MKIEDIFQRNILIIKLKKELLDFENREIENSNVKKLPSKSPAELIEIQRRRLFQVEGNQKEKKKRRN
jgi:hypothetical protein